MRSLNRGLLHKWCIEERGSFTIESVIVFPLLMGLILLFIFFGMYLYQNVIVYYSSSVTAERAAFGWDNSHRETKTGMLLKPEYDGLYRRLGSDGMLASLFGMIGTSEESALALPDDIWGKQGDDSISLPNRKLIKAANWISTPDQSYTGEIFYNGSGFNRYVGVRMRKPIDLFQWESSWIRRDPAAASKAHVVDPVEFIRSVDLVRYYTTKLMNSPMGKTTAKERANQVLSSYEGKK